MKLQVSPLGQITKFGDDLGIGVIVAKNGRKYRERPHGSPPARRDCCDGG